MVIKFKKIQKVLCMVKNKELFIEELKKKTNKSNKDHLIINDILEDTSL